MISAPSIRRLSISGNFAESLNLTDTNTSIGSARIGGSLTGGQWNIFGNALGITAKSAATAWGISTGASVNLLHISTGDFGSTLAVGHLGDFAVAGDLTGGAFIVHGTVSSITARSAAAAWSLTADATVESMHIKRDLAANITAGAINVLTVGGNLHDNTIKTQAAFVAGADQIHKLNVAGVIDHTTINATGNIGIITGAALTNSRLYAGVTSTITTGGTLPTASANFSSAAVIKDVRLGTTKPTFSNSFIAAQTITSLRLGSIKTTNTGIHFGVAGVTLDKITGTLDTGPRLALNQGNLITAATLSSFFSQKKITTAKLNDFQINILT